MKGFTRLMVMVAMAVIGALGFSAVPAAASHVQCGDTITQDTKLDSDLVCAGYFGFGVLTVGENATLDLKGHVIRVLGTTTFGESVQGVVLRDHATVKNGRIEGVVSYLSSSKGLSCSWGVSGFGDGITVKHVRIENCSNGIILEGAHNGVVGNQVLEFTSSEDRIGGWGILVRYPKDWDLPPVTANTVSRNLVFNSSPPPSEFEGFHYETGIEVPSGIGDVVEGNVTDGNSLGLLVHGNRGGTVVKRNYATRSDDLAMYLILYEGSAIRNEARDERGFADAGEIGFWAGGDSMLFERNTASGFKWDGVRVDRPGVTVRKNRSENNGELGINAAAGTIDGGGNKAEGNGNPLQCVNVFCK